MEGSQFHWISMSLKIKIENDVIFQTQLALEQIFCVACVCNNFCYLQRSSIFSIFNSPTAVSSWGWNYKDFFPDKPLSFCLTYKPFKVYI